MATVELRHSAHLPARTLAAARALLDDAFDGDFDDGDWDHTLGGLHALAWDGGELVGASRETVNKALADFVHRGWIQLQCKSVVVLDEERLRRRAR